MPTGPPREATRPNLSSIVDATDPNLSAFYRSGGKLIQRHGRGGDRGGHRHGAAHQARGPVSRGGSVLGFGNPDEAGSYVGYLPATQRGDDFQWAGYPFRSGYEEWCRLGAGAKALVCARRGDQGTTG
jgi:hypothetical protein